MLFCDINDYRLTVRNETGEILRAEPAAAAKAAKNLIFGQAAVDRSRSHPQNFNNRFLYSLAAEPISGDLTPAKNHADLIYHQLLALELPGNTVVFGVAGHVSNTQLGLLLGICREAQITVTGFVDLALTHALALPEAQDFHVLDVEQHRLVLNRISVTENDMTVSQTLPFDGLGINAIVSGWMNVLADEFVQKTRFDPLHAGATEQQLFNQVSAWLQPNAQISPSIVIEQSGAARDIEVNLALLTDKLRQRLEALDLAPVSSLYLTPKAARIPALQLLLGERVEKIEAITDDDIFANYGSLAAQLSDAEVKRVSTAPRRGKLDVPTDMPLTAQPATHLLSADHVARSMTDALFAHHASVANPNGAGLQPGDAIEIDGNAYTAIRLE